MLLPPFLRWTAITLCQYVPPALISCKLYHSVRTEKAAGESGILPEFVKVCSNVFVDNLFVELLVAVWDSEVVPVDLLNAQLVPIPKKGNLAECDNWRGITVLDVLGKVVARIIQSRLSHSMDSVLPDSQFGFWKNRGCMDTVFAA